MSAQQRYWTEFEPTRHQFFKVMMKDFQNKLTIPTKFVENFQVELPDTIYLRGPSGHVWPVKLSRCVHGWVLQGGWSDFVQEHGVRESYFLIFSYEGNHVFRVTIFDKTACEKEDCYFIENPTSKGKKNEAGESSRGGRSDYSFKEKKYTMYLLSKRRPVSEEEKLIVRKLAAAHIKSSTLPSFMKVMKPTHVHHAFCLLLPSKWRSNHIPSINNKEIELRIPHLQRKWSVTVKDHEWKFALSKGWFRFVKDNNLEEGDVCVFELKKQGGKKGNRKRTSINFDVSIYRVVDEIVPLTSVSARELDAVNMS